MRLRHYPEPNTLDNDELYFDTMFRRQEGIFKREYRDLSDRLEADDGRHLANFIVQHSIIKALVPLIFDSSKSRWSSGATVNLNGALSEPLHLREDLVGCFRPLERLALVIVGVHVGGDGVAQRVRAGM